MLKMNNNIEDSLFLFKNGLATSARLKKNVFHQTLSEKTHWFNFFCFVFFFWKKSVWPKSLAIAQWVWIKRVRTLEAFLTSFVLRETQILRKKKDNQQTKFTHQHFLKNETKNKRITDDRQSPKIRPNR